MVLVLALRNGCYKSSLASVIVRDAPRFQMDGVDFWVIQRLWFQGCWCSRNNQLFKNSMVLKLQSLVLPATARYLL
jgi:hypothetical protein